MLAEAKTPGDIIPAINCTRSKTQGIIGEACKRAGIDKSPHNQWWQEKAAIQEFLAAFDPELEHPRPHGGARPHVLKPPSEFNFKKSLQST